MCSDFITITFDLSDLHRSESRSLDFEALYLVKEQF